MSVAIGTRQIELRNVRVNNLKGIDLAIPHGQWLSICGLSGSGKTSLALDTLYAEGQRRYIESLSPYTRQFLQQLDKPQADRIDGIPPAIAVKAARGKSGPHATVGTATEILHYLRLLFAKRATLVCPDCELAVTRDDPESVAAALTRLPPATRFQVGYRISLTEEALGVLEAVKRHGFGRIVIDHKTLELSAELATVAEIRAAKEAIVIVDRLTADSSESRLRESLETAFQFGFGKCIALILAGDAEHAGSTGSELLMKIDGRQYRCRSFSEDLVCGSCQRKFPQPDAKLFSFTSPFGACPKCEGIGMLKDQPCRDCNGTRLNRNALCFRFAGKTIAELCNLKISSLIEFLEQPSAAVSGTGISGKLIPQVIQRLRYLGQVGLGYLALDRSVNSLSSGEAQRVSLTTCLGSTLVNMLYVLDEPSSGLHRHDMESLCSAIAALHRRGNTMVVVDHEDPIIRAAERVIEVGPGAGDSGGEIVFDGTATQLLTPDASLTGEYLAGRRGISVGESRRQPRGRLKLVGARGHNLQDIAVEFPLGCLCVVTGVSGAGKSSLVQQTLYGAICQQKQQSSATPLPCDDLFGASQIEEVVLIDQSPIGRSPRSNPVTYVKAFDDIRKTFAETPDAKTHNLKAGHFSFNVAGGRCDKCEGDGCLTVDMQFLNDVVIICDQCHGTRFNDQVLAVKYRGKNIAEVLDMTVRQSFGFFRGQPKVQAKLKALIDVGLEYIRLGQPANRLSSGEAQRLKLALYLNANRRGRSLFVLDEPTTGLHMYDVVRLLDCFNALLDVGHSLIMVEHNLQLIKHADWIIDLGPGAADLGGRVIAAGTPEQVAENRDSLTGRYLKPLLEMAVDE